MENLLTACRNKQNYTYDILEIDDTHTGLLEDCLVDLWTYDFDLGRTMNAKILENGIVNNKLGKFQLI